jgi:DNA repair protein RadC
VDVLEIDRPACPPAIPAAESRAVRAARRDGAASAEHELLFALLAPCLGWIEAAEAAEAALQRFGSLAAALAAGEAELAALPGLGEGGAATLKAVQAAARHLGAMRPPERPVLRDGAAVVAHLRAQGPLPAGLRAVFLDAGDRLIAEEAAGEAGAAGEGAARRLLRRALALNAATVVTLRVVAGGDPVAQPADILLAGRLAAAGRVMEIELRDHLVVGPGGHASLAGLGLVAPEARWAWPRRRRAGPGRAGGALGVVAPEARWAWSRRRRAGRGCGGGARRAPAAWDPRGTGTPSGAGGAAPGPTATPPGAAPQGPTPLRRGGIARHARGAGRWRAPAGRPEIRRKRGTRRASARHAGGCETRRRAVDRCGGRDQAGTARRRRRTSAAWRPSGQDPPRRGATTERS